MLRMSTGEMIDLLSARYPWSDNLNVRGNSFDRWRETTVADLDGQIVVLFFETK